MGSYYYLAAQLPYLVYGQGVPMSSSAFKEMARDVLSASDAAALEHCILDPDPANTATRGVAMYGATYAESAPKTPSAFINNYREWERTLRLNLAKNRAIKLKREGSAGTAVAIEAPDYPADAAATAKIALGMESPLEAEIYLDKARWGAIESFQGISTFSENAIYAYLLKLMLMERRAAFKTEEGFSEYKALYSTILGIEPQGDVK